MRRPRCHGLMIASLIASLSGARAATITATVTDEAGKPLPDAAVMIAPAPGTPSRRLAVSPISAATIDQKDEAFVPSVVVIRVGGSVVFRNSEKIRHHVYSFSSIRQFEMVQIPGEASPPVIFDRPGWAAIGCNIHDHMTAYVHVTEAPWAKVTDAAGQAVLTDIPAGHFVATVWHPRLRPKTTPPTESVVVASENSTLSIMLSVLPPRRQRGRDY